MSDRTWVSITFNRKQFELLNPGVEVSERELATIAEVDEIRVTDKVINFQVFEMKWADVDIMNDEVLCNLKTDGLDCDFSWGNTYDYDAGEEFYRGGNEVLSPSDNDVYINLTSLNKAEENGENISEIISGLKARQAKPISEVSDE